jgi:hypothetical protein
MTPRNFPSRLFRLLLVAMLLTIPALAKETPLQVIEWPTTGTPTLRFTFGKFKQLGGSTGMRGFVMDTQVVNLSTRLIPAARFSVYLFDKNKVRIGEDVIALSNVGPGETVKFDTTVAASGTPVSLSIQDTALIPRSVSMTVN